MQVRTSPLEGLWYIILVLVWGSSFILIKWGLLVFTPIQLSALRMGVAALCCVPLLPRAIREIPRSLYPKVLVVGLVGSGIPAFLLGYSVVYISSSVNGIINALAPLFTILTGMLIWGTATTRYRLIGVLLGLVGAGLLVVGRSGLDLQGDMRYMLIPITATICYGINNNFIKQYFAEYTAVSVTVLAIAMMGVPVWLILFSTDFVERVQLPHAGHALVCIVLLGVLGTVVRWVLFYRLIQRTDAVVAASVTYMIPVVAIAWGLYDGEQLAMYQYIGLGLILLGVYFVHRVARGAMIDE
jgi:drug/metabolite transporter (DMT)-like permease